MGKFKNNELSGLLGELVACRTKHGVYLRRRPKRTKPPTPKELQSRYVFGLVNRWIQPIADVVRKGFRGYSENYEGRQAAVSEMYKQGLEAKGFESVIHPAQVRVSWGKLGLPEQVSVSLKDQQELEFQWSTELGPLKNPRDRAMLLAYNVTAQSSRWELTGPPRNAGAGILSLEGMPPGEYHIFLGFAGAEKGQSMSAYLGSVVREGD